MKTSDEMTEIVFRKMAIHELKMKERRRKILRTAVPLMLLLVVAAVSFGVWVSYNPEVIKQSFFNDKQGYLTVENPDMEIDLELNCQVSMNLDEMIERADVIARGKLFNRKEEGSDNLVNTNNAPLSATEGVEYKESIGGLYDFKISEVLKGDVNNNIIVYKDYSDIYSYNGYEFTYVNPLYFNHYTGKEYVLFLNKDESEEYYIFASEPNTLLVEKDTLYLHSNIKHDDFYRYAKLEKTDLYIKIDANLPIFEDNITGMTVAELKDAIK